MKQVITIRRVETRVIELEVPESLSTETLTRLVNERLTGVGGVSFGNCTSHQITDWTVSPKGKTGKKGRKS